MPPSRDASFGARVKELRTRAGLSQQNLAATLKRSVSWVSQVERGEHEITSVLVLQQLAAALAVPAGEFVAMVLGEGEEDVRDRPYVEVLRLALAGHPVPEALVGEPMPSKAAGGDLASLEAETARAWVAVHTSAYQQLGPLLAKLIPRLERATRTLAAEDRPRAFELLADVYQVASAMLMKVGDQGAGWIAADRAIGTGERCGDRHLALAGQYRMAHTLAGTDERVLALHVLRQAVRGASAVQHSDDPGVVSLVGACALLLAVLEAREGDRKSAEGHLRIARSLARRLGEDRDDYGTEFGPTNVALHAVAVAVELGNASDAIALAGEVQITGLSPERQARYLVDVARAHAQRRDLAAAVKALEQAESIAPEEVHELGLVRALVGDLEHFAGRRRVPGLKPLRQRLIHN